jgi:hypothetical protein
MFALRFIYLSPRLKDDDCRSSASNRKLLANEMAGGCSLGNKVAKFLSFSGLASAIR